MSFPAARFGAEIATSASPAPRTWHAGIIPYRRYAEIAPLLAGLEGSTFQCRLWLETWLDVFAADPAIEPFLAVFRDDDGRVTMALPLIRRQQKSVSVIEFSDLAVTDYAAPLVLREQSASMPATADLWQRLIDVLPTADLLRFERLAPKAGRIDNPFYSHHWSRPSALSGWVLDMPDSWEECSKLATGSQRGKFKKFCRQLEAVPESELVHIRDVEQGLEALAALTRLQETRLSEQGVPFHIGSPPYSTFYRRLVERAIGSGETMICGIKSGGVWVAVNFAVRNGSELVYLRLGNLYGDWAKLAPGVALTEFLMREAHASGVRTFDFAMGNYEYKRRFGARELPLRDLVLPLSLRGVPSALAWNGREWARSNKLLRRLLGKGDAGRLRGASD